MIGCPETYGLSGFKIYEICIYAVFFNFFLIYAILNKNIT